MYCATPSPNDQSARVFSLSTTTTVAATAALGQRVDRVEGERARAREVVVRAARDPACPPWSAGPVTIRRAGPGDSDALLRLLDGRTAWMRERGIVDQWPMPFPAATVTPDLTAGRTWLVEVGGTLVATFTVGDVDDLWDGDDAVAPAYLHRLAVAAGHAGLGARLVDRLAFRLAAAGRTTLRLDCLASNARLRRFYERAAFLPRGLATVHAVPGDGWPPGASAQVALYERPLT